MTPDDMSADTAGPVDNVDADASIDPFSAEGAPGIILIQQMRIYDVLLGIYSELAPVKAEALMDLHAEGLLLGPEPVFKLSDDVALPDDSTLEEEEDNE